MVTQEIKGFKAFLPGLRVSMNDNMALKIGMTYHVAGKIQLNHNGFHYCKRLEDTLCFITKYNAGVEICEVVGSGNVIEAEMDYYGYYDIYVASDITIVKKLSRLEILTMYRELIENVYYYDQQIARFLHYYPNLTEQDYQYMKAYPKDFPLRAY